MNKEAIKAVENLGLKSAIDEESIPLDGATIKTTSDSSQNKTFPIATVRVKNHSSHGRIQWYRAVLPLAKGILTEENLKNVTTEHGAVGVTPVKWYFHDEKKHSLALVKVQFPMILHSNEEQFVNFYIESKPNPLPYTWGPNTDWLLKNTNTSAMMFMALKLQNDPVVYYAPMWQNAKVLEDNAQSKTFQWTSNFVAPGKSLAMMASYTMTIDNRMDFGDVVIGVHHGDFDPAKLKSGGFNVEYVKLYYHRPFEIEIRGIENYDAVELDDEGEHGVIELVSNENIASASSRVFRGLWNVVTKNNDAFHETYKAELESPGYAMAIEQNWVESKAGGVCGSVIPSVKSLEEMRTFVAANRKNLYPVYINDYVQKLNDKEPGGTGDKILFSGNMTEFQQQAIKTGEGFVIPWALHGSVVEEYRASYWWNHGRRMEWTDTPPDTFFWVGKPHPAHVQNSNPWKARTNVINNYSYGDEHGFVGSDLQHYSVEPLNATYELSGDPYLKGLLEYRLTLACWDYFGTYGWHGGNLDQNGNVTGRMDSERAVRCPIEAYRLVSFNPDSVTAKRVIEAMGYHMQLRLQSALFSKQQYGHVSLETIVNDGRHPLSFNGPLAVLWWTGFSLTFVYLVLKSELFPLKAREAAQAFLDLYMDEIDFVFKDNGENWGSRLLTDISQSEGAFTQSWVATGWYQACEEFGTNHPKWGFFVDKVLPTKSWAYSNKDAFGNEIVFGVNNKWFS